MQPQPYNEDFLEPLGRSRKKRPPNKKNKASKRNIKASKKLKSRPKEDSL